MWRQRAVRRIRPALNRLLMPPSESQLRSRPHADQALSPNPTMSQAAPYARTPAPRIPTRLRPELSGQPDRRSIRYRSAAPLECAPHRLDQRRTIQALGPGQVVDVAESDIDPVAQNSNGTTKARQRKIAVCKWLMTFRGRRLQVIPDT
jgi:hypothetical protein